MDVHRQQDGFAALADGIRLVSSGVQTRNEELQTNQAEFEIFEKSLPTMNTFSGDYDVVIALKEMFQEGFSKAHWNRLVQLSRTDGWDFVHTTRGGVKGTVTKILWI